MKPTDTNSKDQIIYAQNQPEYLPLPAFVTDRNSGIVASCWKCSWRERLKLVATGKIWIEVMTFNRPLQPLRVRASRPVECANATSATNSCGREVGNERP